MVHVSAHVTDLSLSPFVSLYVCLSVGQSVQKLYSGKMAEWIRMPFGMVSRVCRGMGVLDGVFIVEGEGGVFGMNLWCPIVTNGDFVA